MFKNYIAAKKEYLTLKQQRGGGNRNDEDDEFYSQYCSAKKNYLNLKQQFGGDDWHMKHIKEKIKYLENKKRHPTNTYRNYGPQVSSDMETYHKSSNLLKSMVQFSDDSD